MIHMLAYLLIGHYLADFSLQNDFIAQNKAPGKPFWKHVMIAHCAIQAGTVLLATNSILLATFEFAAHFMTDYSKCRGYLTFNEDQTIHIACRLMWLGIYFGVLTP